MESVCVCISFVFCIVFMMEGEVYEKYDPTT